MPQPQLAGQSAGLAHEIGAGVVVVVVVGAWVEVVVVVVGTGITNPGPVHWLGGRQRELPLL